MATVYDVEPRRLIEEAAKKLEGLGVKKPAYVDYVKSGPHAQRMPQQRNFWYIRCAALLRKAYLYPGVGVNRLRVHYGGRKNRGVARERSVKAGGSLIRRAFMALEKAGLVEKMKKGRKATSAGVKFLDGVAKDVLKSG